MPKQTVRRSQVAQIVEEYYANLPQRTPEQVKADECTRVKLMGRPELLGMGFWQNHFEWQEVNQYPQLVSPMLSLGCATGHTTVCLASSGYEITGIDISPLAIKVAKGILAKQPDELRKRVNFVCGDIRTKQSSKIFKSVWASHVLEHIKDIQGAFVGLNRWIERDGYILISVPLGKNYNSPDHVHHWYTIEEAKKEFGQFIKVLKCTINNRHGVIRVFGQFS